ncbi:MAG: pilus assembly protein [Porphyrobacter sp.]|nr:pilus assembly protein [Porphyrobacter sp.]
MRLIRTVQHDLSGVAAVEFALVAPILIGLIFGIWNTGVVLYADNSIRDAVEAGARQATVFPRPSEAQLRQRINDRYFGPQNQGAVAGPTFAYGTRNGAPIVTISMSYTHQVNVPFLPARNVTLAHQRTVYMAPAGTVRNP